VSAEQAECGHGQVQALPARPSRQNAAVRRYRAVSDRDALTIAGGMLKDDPRMVGFDLWHGVRRIAAETRKGKPRHVLSE